MDELTTAQKKILRFIQEYKRGYNPTIREIAQNCGYSSIATIQVHLVNLESKGYITRQTGLARSIRVCKPLPEESR